MGERYPAAGAAKEQAARGPAVCEQAGDPAWELPFRRQIGAVKQSSRKKHQAIRDRTEELTFFEYPKRSRCQCDHLQYHGNGKGKRAETVRILSTPAGGIAADRQDR